MATSKAKKRKKRQQAQRRQAHHHEKAAARDAQRQHLPKTGTKEDDAYLLRRSREDLVDFGLAGGKRGWWTTVIIVAVLALFAAGVVGLLALTR